MLDLPPPVPSIEIVVASQGMSKGLRQTESLQVLARPEVAVGAFVLGAYFKNVGGGGADGEAGIAAGARIPLAGFDLSGSITHKWNTGTQPGADSDAVEFAVGISRPIGPVTPRLSVNWSLDELGTTGESLYAEVGATLRLSGSLGFSAAAARREREAGSDYSAFNAGFTLRIERRIYADLRYYDTNRSAIGPIYRPRLVGSLRARF